MFVLSGPVYVVFSGVIVDLSQSRLLLPYFLRPTIPTYTVDYHGSCHLLRDICRPCVPLPVVSSEIHNPQMVTESKRT